MKTFAAIGFGAAIGGTFVFAYAWPKYDSIKTGVESMDRFAIRGRVLFEAFKRQGRFSTYGIDWLDAAKVGMAIINNESKGVEKNFVGDLDKGVSVGPAQINFPTAKALGLVPPTMARQDYIATYSTDLSWGIGAMYDVLLSKLAATGNLYSAIRAYNGSNSASAAYRDTAVSFLAQKFNFQVGEG